MTGGARLAAAGSLYLVPVPIVGAGTGDAPEAAGSALSVLPPHTLAVARQARYFLAENARSARAFLKSIDHPQAIATLDIVQIGHAPDPAQIDAWLAPLLGASGREPIDAVLVSEAGCPGIADPGAGIVARAHECALAVVPCVGPSAILLALMGAGMNGQAFRFVGYLPQDRAELRERLLQVQQDAQRGETQIFIETPYRSARLFETLVQICAPALRLCLAVELSGPQAVLRTHSVAQWRSLEAAQRPALERRATVFLLHGTEPPAPRPRSRPPRC